MVGDDLELLGKLLLLFESGDWKVNNNNFQKRSERED